MLVRPGGVYRDKGVTYLVTIEHITTAAVRVRLVNLVNWIILDAHDGKPLADGQIDIPSLQGDLVAGSLVKHLRQALINKMTPTSEDKQ